MRNIHMHSQQWIHPIESTLQSQHRTRGYAFDPSFSQSLLAITLKRKLEQMFELYNLVLLLRLVLC